MSERDGEKGSGKSVAGEGKGEAFCPLASLLGMGQMARQRMLDMFPKEFVEHAAGARREFLLAIRSLVDEALRRQEADLREYEERRATETEGPQKVAVE